METNSQQPEGQAAQAPQGQPAVAPEKAANLNQAVERAAESANSAPVKQEQGQPEDWEWDGNPNTLPPQFAKYGKGIQRHFTKRSMAEADLRKTAQEYQTYVQSDDYKQFQEYKKTLGQAPSAQPKGLENIPQQPIISQQDFEDALLDGSGAKFAALVEKVADAKIQNIDKKYSSTVSSLQQQTNTAQWNSALSDFADLHPEAVEYHNMGLMEPIVKEELNSGSHRSYESALTKALERVEKSVNAIRQQEFQRSQGRVVEKKGAVVNTGTSVGDLTSIETDKADAFTKAFEFAAQNKKVKVRTKR